MRANAFTARCGILALSLLHSTSTTTFTNALRQDEVSMGTTILAVRYKDGVVVGADTRTSVQGYVSNRYAAKLTFVLDRKVDNFVASSKEITNNAGEDNDGGASTCVICRSGSAADTQHLASIVRNEMVSRQLLYRIRGTVTHATSLLRNMLVDNEDLSASLICAGYDHELKRGVIYSITPGGTVFEEQTWAAGGSGSTYILGYLDSVHPKDHDSEPSMLQTEEEALEFVSNAIGLAMELDGSSGGFIRMYVVDKHGKKFVTQMPKHNSNGGNGYKSGESRNSIQSTDNNRLENFAPAMTPIKAAKTKSLSSRK